MDNPFIFRAYQTKELFCDRQEELNNLVTNTLSGADTTLIAQRRIGKTGLIYRLIDEIRSENLSVLPIYVDIFATRSLEDFVKALSTAIMNAIPEKSSIGKKFAKFIRSLRPLITYDPLTSTPQIQLTLQSWLLTAWRISIRNSYPKLVPVISWSQAKISDAVHQENMLLLR